MHHKYVPDPGRDEWMTTKQYGLLYADGERIEVGDWVDFGCKFGKDTGEEWLGRVVAVLVFEALVDTYLNTVQGFPPDQLRLVRRQDEKDRLADAAVAEAIKDAAENRPRPPGRVYGPGELKREVEEELARGRPTGRGEGAEV